MYISHQYKQLVHPKPKFQQYQKMTLLFDTLNIAFEKIIENDNVFLQQIASFNVKLMNIIIIAF